MGSIIQFLILSIRHLIGPISCLSLPHTFSRSISPNENHSSGFSSLPFDQGFASCLTDHACLNGLECVKTAHVNLIPFIDKMSHHLSNLITLFFLQIYL